MQMSGGLEGVIAADTVLSHTDSAAGRIWVRGVSLDTLIANHGYEGTLALLWDGFAGDGLTRAGVQAALGAGREKAFDRLPQWLPAARGLGLDAAIRLCLAMVPDDSIAADVAGTLAVGVPALLRLADGQEPVAPNPALPVAADLLRMLHGSPAEPAAARALDTYFTAMSESGLSASSFAVRVVASTHASLPACVLAGWCAFSGKLHGGAPGPTLDFLDELAAADDVDACISGKLARGERLMGFGHRLFRGNDPRVIAFREVLRGMGDRDGRLAFAEDVEARVARAVERAKPGRKLPPNVEIMAALLLDAVGLPRHAFTPVFAVARCGSWIAHALEQGKGGRLYRPASRYTGPPVA
jgi:citrate synthase